VFFSWWLDNILYQRYEDKLKMRVKTAFPFLFKDLGAKFVN